MMETFEIADTLEGLGIAHEKAHYIAETIKDKSVSTRDIAEIKDRIARVENGIEKLEISNIEIKNRITKIETVIEKLEASNIEIKDRLTKLEISLETKATKEDVSEIKASIGKIETSIRWLTVLLITFSVPILVILLTKTFD